MEGMDCTEKGEHNDTRASHVQKPRDSCTSNNARMLSAVKGASSNLSSVSRVSAERCSMAAGAANWLQPVKIRVCEDRVRICVVREGKVRTQGGGHVSITWREWRREGCGLGSVVLGSAERKSHRKDDGSQPGLLDRHR